MKANIEYDEHGLLFIPHFIQQDSDLYYGEVVTHENYNEKLNLNRLQGDYNTEVLRILFTDKDATKVPHIPYLDKKILDNYTALDERITENTNSLNSLNDVVSDNSAFILDIVNGKVPIEQATQASKIVGIENAGNKKYYGTDSSGTVGFHRVPDSIYTVDSSENTVEVTGVYFTPQADSIDKTMLTPSLRELIEQSSITTYPALSDKPRINNVELIDNVTLEQIGVQPAGNYLTEIPTEYITETELTEALVDTLSETEATKTFATIAHVTELETNLTNYQTEVSNKYPVIAINTFTGTPKTGDLLITL